MNYLIQLWRKWRCPHSFKYAMRISCQGAQWEVWECNRCMKLRYDKIHEDDIHDPKFKDL